MPRGMMWPMAGNIAKQAWEIFAKQNVCETEGDWQDEQQTDDSKLHLGKRQPRLQLLPSPQRVQSVGCYVFLCYSLARAAAAVAEGDNGELDAEGAEEVATETAFEEHRPAGLNKTFGASAIEAEEGGGRKARADHFAGDDADLDA